MATGEAVNPKAFPLADAQVIVSVRAICCGEDFLKTSMVQEWLLTSRCFAVDDNHP